MAMLRVSTPLLSSFIINKLCLHFPPPSFIFCWSLLENTLYSLLLKLLKHTWHVGQGVPVCAYVCVCVCVCVCTQVCLSVFKCVCPTWKPAVIVSQIAMGLDLLTSYHWEQSAIHTHTHTHTHTHIQKCCILQRQVSAISQSTQPHLNKICVHLSVFLSFSHQQCTRTSTPHVPDVLICLQ